MEQVKTRTDHEELQELYDMLQAAYIELQADNDRLNKRLHMMEVRAIGKDDYIKLCSAVRMVRTALLNGEEKSTYESIAYMILLEDHEQLDIYTKILVKDVQYYNGNVARADTIIDRLIKKELFLQYKSVEDKGVYLLAIPVDIFRRLKSIPTKRGWKSPWMWCAKCGHNVRLNHGEMYSVKVLRGECGHILEKPQGSLSTIDMNGIEKKDISVSDVLQAIHQAMEEYEVSE